MGTDIIGTATIAIRASLGKPNSDSNIDNLYRDYDYLEAYARHTDLRVEDNPKTAIGGMWEEIGKLQFDFLVTSGLKRRHRLLDIGCGTLRGGRHFIKYLDVGNYFGFDISPKAIEAGLLLVSAEGLEDKTPHLSVSKNKDLKFGDFSDNTFDVILAQSVFTHLQPHHIEECFTYVKKIVHQHSKFFFHLFCRRRPYKNGFEELCLSVSLF